MKAFTPLEDAVLRKLLEGGRQWLSVLRAQFNVAQVSSREHTGTGFYTDFSVPHEAPALPNEPSFRFGDVSAEINDLLYGAGFLVVVKDGYLDYLEGYSYEEPWPENIHAFHVYYSNSKDRDEDELEKNISYDPSSLRL
jgi:hypothetical protein